MVFSSVTRTLQSLKRRGTLVTALTCVIVTAIILLLWIAGVTSLMQYTTLFTTGWLESAIDWLFSGASVIASWFLFPLLFPLIASQLVDGFMARIARDEYGQQMWDVPLLREIKNGVKFLALGLAINLVLLPVYAIPLIGQALYLVVNASLLSGEFWEMICQRLKLETASLRHRRLRLLMLGLVIVVSGSAPVLNLLTPLIAAALTLHLAMQAREQGEVQPLNQ